MTELIHRFSQEIDSVLERYPNWIDGHWILIGPLDYIFPSEPISIELCRRIADVIESKGYCVETDVRSGCGGYAREQSLALFKAFDGDPVAPSVAYLEAANSLRICLQVAAADDWIEIAKLEVIRQALDRRDGLSRTDRKRLLILEQLLAQKLCESSYYAVTKIIKSIPVDQRIPTLNLLVQVAVAGNVMTKAQRRVLGRISEAFEMPTHTLQELIDEACPAVCYDASKSSYWSLKKWRIAREGIFIDDFILADKRWNFTNWKLLNARWRTLHDQLVASV